MAAIREVSWAPMGGALWPRKAFLAQILMQRAAFSNGVWLVGIKNHPEMYLCELPSSSDLRVEPRDRKTRNCWVKPSSTMTCIASLEVRRAEGGGGGLPKQT